MLDEWPDWGGNMLSIKSRVPALLLLILVVAAACGDSDEENPSVNGSQTSPGVTATATEASGASFTDTLTATPTASSTNPSTQTTAPTSAGHSGDDMEGTAVPIISPIATFPASRAGWLDFHDSNYGFSLQYPPDWYLDSQLRRVQSWDPATWTSRGYPDGGILVEVAVTPSNDGAAPTPDGASAATLGDMPGWRVVRTYANSAAGQTSWSHGIQTVSSGNVFTLIAFFEQANPDDSIFLQIASTFRFDK
jgi:hypothetical protein